MTARHLLFAAALLLPAAAWAMQRRIDEEGADAAPADAGIAELPLVLDEPGLLERAGIFSMSSTRGERNNNPGNIRKSTAAWQGKTTGADTAFETFTEPKYGIRALARTLKNYQSQYGLRTVRQIINRWAPASENDTDSYVMSVSRALGVFPDDPIDLGDGMLLEDLTTAIIHHENGRVIYSAADIAEGVALA